MDYRPDHKLLNATEIFVYGTIWTAVWGSAVWFGKDKVTNYRERKDRRQRFLAFINVWELEMASDRDLQIVTPGLPPRAYQKIGLGSVANQFDSQRLKLVEKATELESNYRGKNRSYFWLLVKSITDMTPGGVESADGRQRLLRAIRDLAAFVKKN